MKKQKIIIGLICLLALGFVAFWACNKDDDITPVTVEKVSYDTDSIDGLKAFIQNHFEEKYEYLLEKDNLKSSSILNNFYDEYHSKNEANNALEKIKEEKHLNSLVEEQYLGYKVKTKIKDGTISIKGNEISFLVYIYDEIFSDAGEEATTKELNLYEFDVKKSGDTFIILSEKIHPWIEGPESEQLSTNNTVSKSEEIPEKSGSSYTYSSKNAVQFAKDHWNNVSNVKGYYNYTNYGGDCTNFLSWCLSKGGWTQNDNWFFISNGKSGNSMSKYKRSYSWTGANYFYQYITAKDIYSKAKGDNRVTLLFTNLEEPYWYSLPATWTKFYNKIKLLKLGDIVEISDGGNPPKIHHNMIVNYVWDKSPYVKVSFRNDSVSNNQPEYNFGINKLNGGDKLFGFNVKSNAN